MSVGFGLIGSGFMAHTYAQCLAEHVPDGHLVALAEGSRAPALASEYGVEHVASAADLLARADVDAALICTPHSTHRELTEAAAAAGKHVYIEKPMAVTLAGCDAMIGACRDARVLLDVNHVTRFRASPVAAKGLIDNGSIGELRIVRILSSVVAYLTDDHGWAHKAGEGGAWLDMGVHLFDALRWFTDSEVEVIFARVRDFAGDPNQRRTGLAEVVMRNDVIVQMLISFEVPKPGLGSQSQWTFIGSEGIVESDSYGKVRLGRGDGWEDIFEMPPFALNADVYSPIRLAAFAEQTQQFALAVQAGYTDAPGFHGEDGRAAVEVVEAGLRSSERGEAIHLPIEPA
jgi:myo-inositol 2-dehydrogenase/D-chiro-inositol 1-dehydrogenase